MMHGKLLVLGRGGGGGGKIGRNERAEGGNKGELKENDTGVTNAMHTPMRYTRGRGETAGNMAHYSHTQIILYKKKKIQGFNHLAPQTLHL
jgi:hypothetical protein